MSSPAPTTPTVAAAPTNPTAPTGPRLQLALDVDDLEASVAFYTALLGTPPAKRREGYANFAVAEPPLKLVLIERPGRGGQINHLGIEVPDTAAVDAARERLAEAGLVSLDERGTVCCWARQDKVWVEGAPNGEQWEVYTVLEDAAVERDDSACCSDSDAACC